MVMDAIKNAKFHLRAQLKAARAQLSQAQTHEYSEQITQTLLHHPLWKNAHVIVGFVGIHGEPDTTQLLQQALNERKCLLLPRVVPSNHTNGLEFIRITSLQTLASTIYGLLEPASGIAVALEKLRDTTLILVPGLGFSALGARLGFGKGYYDRALAPIRNASNIVRVGLCLPPFLLADIPTAAHDIPMHWIATSRKLINCQNGSSSYPRE